MKVLHLITLIVIVIALLSMAEADRRRRGGKSRITRSRRSRGGHRSDSGSSDSGRGRGRKSRRERKLRRQEEKLDREAKAARLLDESREKSKFGEKIGFKDRAAAEERDASGTRFADSDKIYFAEQKSGESFTDFADERQSKEAHHKEVKYIDAKEQHSGEKTQFSNGKKSRSDIKFEQNDSTAYEDFNKHESAHEKHTEGSAQTEKEHDREKTLSVEDRFEKMFDHRFFNHEE